MSNLKSVPTQAVTIELNRHAAEIRRLGKRVVEDVIEIGARLTECKRLAGHGHWLSWLDREFGWSDETASRFMRVHSMAGQKPQLVEFDLPVSALYLLAKASPEVIAEVERDVKAGNPPTVQAIQAMVTRSTRQVVAHSYVVSRDKSPYDDFPPVAIKPAIEADATPAAVEADVDAVQQCVLQFRQMVNGVRSDQRPDLLAALRRELSRFESLLDDSPDARLH